ncbi:MAG TPA: sporulation initiation factor Spo0A C-terminal domain-containing protein [Anaerovoracaceae bacterium]|nr:sporulation initiation factor Spo0A C-terminal domain-containing protein [Anaerovoracaceae bacterium]
MNLNEVYLLFSEDSLDYLKEEYINEIINRKILDVRISMLLDEYGIQSNYCGYEYLKESIITVKENSFSANAITKQVYPLVAKKYDTNNSCVEHAIRHALKSSYSKGFMDMKYTNCQFIYKIAKII